MVGEIFKYASVFVASLSAICVIYMIVADFKTPKELLMRKRGEYCKQCKHCVALKYTEWCDINTHRHFDRIYGYSRGDIMELCITTWGTRKCKFERRDDD